MCESVGAKARIVTATRYPERSLRAFVQRIVVIGRNWRLVRQQAGNRRRAVISRVIPVNERRYGHQDSRLESVYPGKVKKTIALTLRVANAGSLLIRGVGHLEEVGARGGCKPQLIIRGCVEDE